MIVDFQRLKKLRERWERQCNAALKSAVPGFHGALRSSRIRIRKSRWMREVRARHSHELPLLDRSHLPVLLDLLNLRGEGVEIGVLNGYFSEIILMYSSLSVLHSVDPWREFDVQQYDDTHNSAQAEHDRRYAFTKERLRRYGVRSHILRETSEEAAHRFADASLDFVYIDGNHSYEACKQDIAHWWSKVKPGGVLAGHDYVDGNLPEGNFGVKSAVDEFAQKERQHLFVIPVTWPTWYVVKG
jgi:hypothetical protein